MRRGGALRHPDRSAPRLGSRFAVGTRTPLSGYVLANAQATMVAAIAVAVGASAAAASDEGAGNHATKTAWHVSDDGRGDKIAHDSPVSATGKDTSAQSTPASANGDHSASPFKPTVDHHAIVDPGIKLDLI